ncbi:MAG: hypothetical protein N3A61_00515 [Ignavibacteria bacterium]|nr:hypothetical protein [Ignavibacteria bacterium]
MENNRRLRKYISSIYILFVIGNFIVSELNVLIFTSVLLLFTTYFILLNFHQTTIYSNLKVEKKGGKAK